MAAGVHGLNGAHAQKFVEEEWRQGIASVTAQPQHMEEETVVEKGQKNLPVTPTIVQVVYHETRLILLITHNLSPPPGPLAILHPIFIIQSHGEGEANQDSHVP